MFVALLKQSTRRTDFYSRAIAFFVIDLSLPFAVLTFSNSRYLSAGNEIAAFKIIIRWRRPWRGTGIEPGNRGDLSLVR